MSAVPLPETAAWRSQSPVGGHHFSETRPTGAVEKYPQTPLVTMEAAIAYGAACAAEERELAAMIVQANAEVCTGGLRTVLMSNAAAIRASAMPESEQG